MYFVMPGCNNKKSVFEASLIAAMISHGIYSKPAEFIVNGVRRNKPYLLAYSIYAKSHLFVLNFLCPSNDRESYFSKRQEGRGKDVERSFVVFQSKFQKVVTPSKS